MSSKRPKSYGRQAKGKTIKSVSLQKDLVQYGEEEAARLGISFSQWVERLVESDLWKEPEDSDKD